MKVTARDGKSVSYSLVECCTIRPVVRQAPNGSDQRFQPAPLGHRRPAVLGIVDKLSRPRRDFIRVAAAFQGLSSNAGKQGPAALFFFLVVRAHAGSDWLVLRPLQPALALC